MSVKHIYLFLVSINNLYRIIKLIYDSMILIFTIYPLVVIK